MLEAGINRRIDNNLWERAFLQNKFPLALFPNSLSSFDPKTD